MKKKVSIRFMLLLGGGVMMIIAAIVIATCCEIDADQARKYTTGILTLAFLASLASNTLLTRRNAKLSRRVASFEKAFGNLGYYLLDNDGNVTKVATTKGP